MVNPDASAVAKWFIRRSQSEDRTRPITNLKLQKLVYYAQAWHLALCGQPLFDDPIEAWIHGPVVPRLYFEYRNFGFNPIVLDQVEPPELDQDTEEHLEEVWGVYGHYDAKYLEALTHEESPWQIAREDLDQNERSTAVITHDSMRDYYRALRLQLEIEDAERYSDQER